LYIGRFTQTVGIENLQPFATDCDQFIGLEVVQDATDCFGGEAE